MSRLHLKVTVFMIIIKHNNKHDNELDCNNSSNNNVVCCSSCC